MRLWRIGALVWLGLLWPLIAQAQAWADVVVVGIRRGDPLAARLDVELQSLGYSVRFGDWETVLQTEGQVTVVRFLPIAGATEIWVFDRPAGRLRRRVEQRLNASETPRVQALKIVEMLRAELRQRNDPTLPLDSRQRLPEPAPPENPAPELTLEALGGAQFSERKALLPAAGLRAGVTFGSWNVGLSGRAVLADQLATQEVSNAHEFWLLGSIRWLWPLSDR